MQSEVNKEENLNRIITVPNLLSFFRLCLIPVIIWSYCVKKTPRTRHARIPKSTAQDGVHIYGSDSCL